MDGRCPVDDKPKPQNDFWAGTSAPAQNTQSPTPTPTSEGNDDWKIWQAGDSTAPDWRQSFDEKYVAPQMAPPNEGLGHHIMRGASNFGGGVIGGVTAPFLHPIETAKSAFAMSPVGMAWNAAHGDAPPGTDLMHSLREHPEETIESGLGNLVGGADMAGVGMEAAPKITDAIPTKAKAGRMFDDVMRDAQNQPVTLSQSTMEPLERTQQLAMAGGKPFGAADKLFQRIQTINPLDYREARDFASNMSLSPEEKMTLKRSMKYEVPRLSKSFNEDVGRAAANAGRGEDYNNAMKTYRRASMMSDAATSVGKTAKRMAIPAALGAGGYSLYRSLEK